ncbi:MAG: beta-lactamase family protein, partial [Acidimicrobiia bacterium]|nr:beta-lactamase family protein [Acidimicrobiia bacterium]
ATTDASPPASAPAPSPTVPDSRPPSTASTTTTVPPTQSPPSPDAWSLFDVALAGRLLGRGDYAASVAVAVNGEVLHTAAYGSRVPAPAPPAGLNAPPPAPEPVEAADRFRIASISKVITATVVLDLVEDGAFDLDQPVGAVLAAHVGATSTDPAVGAITARQLLSHTSGFDPYDRTFFGGGSPSCVEAAQRGLSRGLNSAPGSAYRYSNMNFCLLGLLIEQVTGQPYADVVGQRLLDPLGIEGMRIAGTFDPDPAEVEHPSVATRNYMEALGGAGAWMATAADVVRIVDALDPDKPGWHPLSEQTAATMRLGAPGITYPPDQWYGLGLIVSADGTWGHSGTLENTHAMVLHRPDGVTWCVLVSGEYPGQTERLRAIFDESMAEAGITLS